MAAWRRHTEAVSRFHRYLFVHVAVMMRVAVSVVAVAVVVVVAVAVAVDTVDAVDIDTPPILVVRHRLLM